MHKIKETQYEEYKQIVVENKNKIEMYIKISAQLIYYWGRVLFIFSILKYIIRSELSINFFFINKNH